MRSSRRQRPCPHTHTRAPAVTLLTSPSPRPAHLTLDLTLLTWLWGAAGGVLRYGPAHFTLTSPSSPGTARGCPWPRCCPSCSTTSRARRRRTPCPRGSRPASGGRSRAPRSATWGRAGRRRRCTSTLVRVRVRVTNPNPNPNPNPDPNPNPHPNPNPATPLHFDPHENMLCVVEGAKHLR